MKLTCTIKTTSKEHQCKIQSTYPILSLYSFAYKEENL